MKNTKKFLIAIALICLSHSALASMYLPLPDGNYVEIPDGLTDEFAFCLAYTKFPTSFSNKPPAGCFGSTADNLIKFVSAQDNIKVIALPNGTWYENKSGLNGKALYCKSFFDYPNAWIGHENSLKAIGCNGISENKNNLLSNARPKTLSEPSIDIADALSKGLFQTALGVIAAILFFLLVNPKSKNTPQLYARWLACRFSFLLVIVIVDEGMKLIQRPNERNYFLGSIYLTVFVYLLVYVIAFFVKKSSTIKSANLTSNNDAWQTFLNESESSARDNGLWAKCFAEADGDESKAKARYIKYRVEQLKK